MKKRLRIASLLFACSIVTVMSLLFAVISFAEPLKIGFCTLCPVCVNRLAST